MNYFFRDRLDNMIAAQKYTTCFLRVLGHGFFVHNGDHCLIIHAYKAIIVYVIDSEYLG